MFRASFSQRVIVVGLLTALLAGGNALAQRGGRGGGGGGEGGRSSSRGGGGGGGGGGESRSFSRGGGGSGSTPSFSRGNSGGSSRSMSPQSFGGGSSRSFSGDSGRSSRSFSSESGATRQFRPSDSGNSSRSFSPQARSSFQGSRSSQEFDRGSTQLRSSIQPESGRSTFSPSTRGTFQSDQTFGRTGGDSSRSSDAQRRFSQGGQPNSQGGQQYQARRPNEEQVRNFLQMRGESSAQGQANTRGESGDGRSFRGDSDAERRTEVARQFGDSNRDGVNRNFGNTNRNRDLTNDFQNRDRNRDFDRDRDSDRDLANRGGGDRDYQRWREGAWSRDRNDDHRDWSGRWRDGNRFDYARNIRNDWHGRNKYPFHGNWWTGHNQWHGDRWNWWGSYASRYNRPYFWWSWTTAPLLTNWVSFGWNSPYYWDYGPGEYIYCDDGVVYVNGRWYQPAPIFYERTVQIVERAPELTPDEAAQLEWLPLGVFAVTPDGAAQADVLVQLAVTKDGVIGGTANDQRSGTAYSIEGTVDKQTQRAVWSYTNERNQKIIMETSIYNLTQPEATGLVHYGPNDFRVVELVRLEDPGQGTSPSAAGAINGAAGELPAP